MRATEGSRKELKDYLELEWKREGEIDSRHEGKFRLGRIASKLFCGQGPQVFYFLAEPQEN